MKYEYYFTCHNSFIGRVVHHKDCRYLRNNRKKFLGSFPDYLLAVAATLQLYPKADHCQACLQQQHKTEDSHKTKSMNLFLLKDGKADIRKPKEPAPRVRVKTSAHINRVPKKHT